MRATGGARGQARAEKVGFEVLSFDKDDTAAAREMGRLLGWGELGMNLETGLFGHITLLRRPKASPTP